MVSRGVKRRPIAFKWREQTMVGTMHVPVDHVDAQTDRVAMLFLNAGPAPRAGNSDMSAYLADCLALRGMTGFRFDLPGLGDSTGPSWPDSGSFWIAAQHGRNDAAVTSLVENLCEWFGLRGVLLGGLCAGALTSVRVGEGLGDRLLGLVLLEPDFREAADVNPNLLKSQSESLPQPKSLSLGRQFRRKILRLRDIDEWLYFLTSDNSIARPFRALKPLLNTIIERRLGQDLPVDVLIDAVSAWRRLLGDGIPTLLVVAAGLGTDRYIERIMRTFGKEGGDLVRTVVVPGTNHILTAGDARHVTSDALVRWVAQRFPSELSTRHV